MAKEFHFPLKIYSDDTDCFGIVYHTNFIKYMTRARTEAFSELGYELHTFQEEGYIFLVHSINIDYMKPAKLGDHLDLVTRVVELRLASVLFDQYVVFQSDPNSKICQAQVRIACINNEMKPERLPKSIYKELQSCQLTNPSGTM